MLQLLQVALSVCHQVHDGARVEDILPVERPHYGTAVLAAATARLQAKLIGVQKLGSVQAEDHLQASRLSKLMNSFLITCLWGLNNSHK